MAKSLQQLGAGEGHVLPDPVVAPVTSPGQGVAASPTRIVEADGVHFGTGGSMAWLRSDGAIVADAYSSVDDTLTDLTLSSYDHDGNLAQTYLRSVAAPGEEAGFVAQSLVGNSFTKVTAYTGGGQITADLLDASGASHFVRKTSWVTSHSLPCEINTEHVGAATPTGGSSGDIKVGNGVIWVNDAGTWKSAPVT